MRKKTKIVLNLLLSLALLLGLIPGMSLTAYAAETLLTTITPTGQTTYSETTSGVVSVIATSVQSYGAQDGWKFNNGTVTVAPADGVEIAKVRFRQNGYSVDDDKSPFTLTFSGGLGEVVTSTGIVYANNNMNGVTSIEVYGPASKAAQTITASDVAATYGDTDKSVSASVTEPTTGGGAITYAVKDGSGDYINVAADGKLTIMKVPASGKAYVIVKAAETDDYAETTKEVTVTISKADPTAPTGLTATYGQTLANVTLSDGWTWVDSTQSVGNVVDPAATFKANFAGDDNHNAASNVDVTVTVGKANAVAATVTANSRTYDGTEKPLVTVTGEATGGEMQYALGTATEATEPYTTSIPTKTEAGTYYVWYKVVGDENHLDTNPQCLTVIIKGYNTIDGEGQNWTKGSPKGAEFTFRDTVEDNTYGQFMDGGKMYLDGSTTPMAINTDFTARKGSLIITLEPSYLETLTAEKHTLRVVFGDTGEVTTYFYVKNKSTPGGGDSDSSASYKLPKTGIE